MRRWQPFYEEDLAYIHDVGFSQFIVGCAPGLLGILADVGIHEGLVVDLGCGGGIWAEHLVQAGYQVLGLDISPAMIEMAAKRVPSAELLIGSFWNLHFPRCRAVTALGEVVCYRPPEDQGGDLSTLFPVVFEALEPGGLLIFDVAEVGLDRHSGTACSEGEDWACLVRFEYDDQPERLTRHITAFRKVGELYHRTRERHVVQLYREADVADLLRQAGFQVQSVRKFGSFPLLPQRVGFVARKP